MGIVKRFNLKRLTEEFNTDFFFETGTWKGDSVDYAAQQQFKKIISSEIVPEIADRAKKRFENDKRITILQSNSIAALETYSNQMPGNCIFWLDAHFPGSEEGLREYNSEEENDKKYPLRRELEGIYNLRKQYNDVILIDDLRIYEKGNFKSGNMPENILRPKEKNINFIYEMFASTHNIFKSLMDEGYVYALPKNKKAGSFIHKIENLLYKRIY